jgi:putative transposase
MNGYCHGSNSDFEIHLHLVWVTKHRKPVKVSPIGKRARELIREICGSHDVQILKGHISKDHVHLLVSIPPKVMIACARRCRRPKFLRFIGRMALA